MKTIIFDQDCSAWCRRSEANRTYLDMQILCLKEILKTRGYIYLNQVYEALGARWNPDDDNVCYQKGEGFNIDAQPLGNEVYGININ